MKIRMITACVGVGLAVGLMAASAYSHEDGEKIGTHHPEAETAKPAGATSLRGLWQEVKTHESELDGLIRSKELSKVHEAAFAVRDSVAQMPGKSDQLSADQQKKLASNVKYVAALAERLDAAGDSNDQAATEASFKQLQSVLAGIAAIYPAGALQ